MKEAPILSFATVLRREIETVNPATVLEWGPGESTQIILDHSKCESLTSIEHSEDWYTKAVRRFVPSNRLFLALIACTNNNSYYATAPLYWEERYDLIFIDGRRRVECLLTALNVLKEGGRILLHDYQRPNYRRLVESLPHCRVISEDDFTAVIVKESSR